MRLTPGMPLPAPPEIMQGASSFPAVHKAFKPHTPLYGPCRAIVVLLGSRTAQKAGHTAGSEKGRPKEKMSMAPPFRLAF